MSPYDSLCNTQKPPPLRSSIHYKTFDRIKKQFPGTQYGNRCGHRAVFKGLPALMKNGKRILRPNIISSLENKAVAFFRQDYKIIFQQCPTLKAAHNSKSGVMRSELRESLALTASGLIRLMDLSTLAFQEERSITEMYRFMAYALSAEGEGRRTSPDRIFRDIKILREAGLITYHLPPAVQLAEGQWEAAPANIGFTQRFWTLIKACQNQLNKAKNDALQKCHKLLNLQEKANIEVMKRRINHLAQESERKFIAQAAKLKTVLNPVQPPAPHPTYPQADSPYPAAANEAWFEQPSIQPESIQPESIQPKPIKTRLNNAEAAVFEQAVSKLRAWFFSNAFASDHPNPIGVAQEAYLMLSKQGEMAVFQAARKLRLV